MLKNVSAHSVATSERNVLDQPLFNFLLNWKSQNSFKIQRCPFFFFYIEWCCEVVSHPVSKFSLLLSCLENVAVRYPKYLSQDTKPTGLPKAAIPQATSRRELPVEGGRLAGWKRSWNGRSTSWLGLQPQHCQARGNNMKG